MRDKILLLIIGLYYLLYESVFFHHQGFLGSAVILVVGGKAVLPLLLLALGGGGLAPLLKIPSIAFYLLSFVVLLVIVAISTAFSPETTVVFYDWFKLPPRLVYFVAILLIFYQKPYLFLAVAKGVLLLAGLTVLQYFILVATQGHTRQHVFPGVDAIFAGPFGILGNVSSMFDLPGLPISVVRLCGFWNEPSNASATLAVAYFFSRHPRFLSENRFWRRLGALSLLGAFLTLSNAGYLAIAGAFGIRPFLQAKQRPLQSLVILSIAVFLGVSAISGRSYVARNFPNNQLIKSLFGVREDLTGRNLDEYDPFSGRLDIMTDTIGAVMQYPLGFGIYTVSSSTRTTLSASAPLIWFTYGGVLALIALIVRESVLIYTGLDKSRREPNHLILVQALVAVFLQNMSYGDLMGPLYLTLTALVLLGAGVPGRRRYESTPVRRKTATSCGHEH